MISFLKSTTPAFSVPERCLTGSNNTNTENLTHLLGPSEQNISERSTCETPLPRNTFSPWNSLAPRVHFPSMSENTDTTSPAFMTENTQTNTGWLSLLRWRIILFHQPDTKHSCVMYHFCFYNCANYKAWIKPCGLLLWKTNALFSTIISLETQGHFLK